MQRRKRKQVLFLVHRHICSILFISINTSDSDQIDGIIKPVKMIFVLVVLLHLFAVESTDYSLILDEKSPIDGPIFFFNRSYDLINNFQSNFNLTSNQKELILTKTIDRDVWCAENLCSCEICSFLLQLFSNENSTDQFSTLNVTINDINDHSPQFFDIRNPISLSESIQIGYRFPIARVVDFDSGLNGKMSFQLIQSENYFQLDFISLSSTEFAIYGLVQRTLDREMFDEYHLKIIAQDHGIPQSRSNQTNLTIIILDENDNAPKFNQTEYSIHSLRENTPIGSELIRIFASDADQGLNGLVSYSIVNPSNSTTFPFVINSSSGILSLLSSLDYETTHSYRFLIRASDCGVPKSLFTDTWLSISIEDVNDCPPQIHFVPHRRFQMKNRTLFIEENLPIENLTLAYLRLTDRDSMSTKLSLSLVVLDDFHRQDYRLIPSNQQNTFSLVVIRGNFDREIQSEIFLRFVASDQFLTSNFDLKISLIDLNDNPSEFPSNPMKFSVEELANYQMIDRPTLNDQIFLAFLNATDRDEGENARNIYQIETNPYVKVDSTTGRLVLLQPLDREKISKIRLKAKATNVAPPQWITEVQLEIDVLDVNDEIPRCLISSHRLTIAENSPIEKSLVKISSVDLDNGVNGTINYFLRTNSSWPFEIDRTTGEIFSKKIFDYESQWKSFSLIIDLEDRGFPIKLQRKNACELQILIEDVNDNRPELIDDRQREIFYDFKTLKSNWTIFFNATDRDSGNNGKVKFTLQSIESTIHSNSTDSMFQLNSNGILEILQPIKEISFFKLKILLEDFGFPTQENSLWIFIAIGDLTNPQFSSFEKVSSFFDQQRSQSNQFAFLLALTVLILTCFCFISMFVVFCLIRKHRRRHQTAILARKQLLCSSSQQLTISPSSFDQKHFLSTNYSPESSTYKILHIPIEHQQKFSQFDEISCDHGYHGSYQTGSPTSSSSIEIPRHSLVQQLPDFVTRCQNLTNGFILEMNVDGSDEDTREFSSH